jgi:integrase
MPNQSDIERRNRALVAFTLLTGARDGAIASFKLKHVDLAEGCVYQDAHEVRTKFSKSFTTWFFPVDGAVRRIVEDWVAYLRIEKLWGLDDPLFPSTLVGLGPTGEFRVLGLAREHWGSAGTIRAIFKEAFECAGLPYANPHSFRNTLAQLGERLCVTAEAAKAWSQNLGHDHVMTTFTNYGALTSSRQAAILRTLAGQLSDDSQALEIGRKVIESMKEGRPL